MERWKTIKGFENYLVSSMGNVRHMDSSKIRQQQINRLGYVTVMFEDFNKKKCNKSIHRLVATAFIPNLQNKPDINHIDGNKLNNCIKNLEWCTKSENQKHRRIMEKKVNDSQIKVGKVANTKYFEHDSFYCF